MRNWLNAPNIVTLLRLLLTPVVILAVVAWHPQVALGIFMLAAATDGVDGWLARRLKAFTQLGAYLDPIADKALLSGTYVALAFAGRVPVWFVGVVFGRDLLILAGAVVLLLVKKRRRFPPSLWGKLSTLLQSLGAVAVLVAAAFPQYAFEWSAATLVWAAAVATVWSGVHYAWRAAHWCTANGIDLR